MFRKIRILSGLLAAIGSCSFLFMIAVGNFCIYTDVFTYDGNRSSSFIYDKFAGLPPHLVLFAECTILLFFIYVLLPEIPALLRKLLSKEKKQNEMRSRKKRGAFFSHFLAAGVFLAGFVLFRDKLCSGFLMIANELAEEWSSYFGINIPPMNGIDKISGGNAEAVLFLLLLFFWWSAVSIWRWKKITIAVIPSLVLVCTELLVGFAPQLPGVLLCLTGFFGMIPFCRKDNGKRKEERECMRQPVWLGSGILTAGGICICFAAAAFFGNDLAERLAGKQNQVLSFQWSLEDRMMEWEIFNTFQGESGRVSNRKPQYQEKNVMRLLASKIPEGPLYLRGYTGDIYQYGSWKNLSRKDFPQTAAVWQKPEAGLAVLNMAYQFRGDSAAAEGMQYELEYLDTGNDYAYLPYYTNLNRILGDSETDAIAVEADMTVYRNGNEKLYFEGAFTNSELGSLYVYMDTDGYRQDGFTDDELESQERASLISEYTEIMELYERDYMARYLDVPDNLSRIKELGKQLQEEMDDKYGSLLNKLEMAMGDIDGNIYFGKEIIAAYIVRNAILNRTEYQLDLEGVPMGKDVTEYFLFDSGKGFCQHYASAGVLLLRELGIPARYVTGFRVATSALSENWENEDGHTAYVKDSDAHAWVEIYKSGVGWIPVEMTKGVSLLWDTLEINVDSDLPAIGIYYSREDEDFSRNTVVDLSMYPDEEIEDQQEDEEKNSEQKTENDNSLTINENESNRQIQEDGISTQEKNEGYPSEGNGEGMIWQKQGFFHILFAVLLMFSGAAFVIAYFYSKRLKRMRLKQHLRPGKTDYSRTVISISGAIYRLMRKRGLIRGKSMDDAEVKQALRQAHLEVLEEELERYFEITERAAFTGDEIDREEASFCYEIYLKLQLLK